MHLVVKRHSGKFHRFEEFKAKNTLRLIYLNIKKEI